MRFFSGLRPILLIVLGLMVVVSRLEAQTIPFTVTVSSNPIGVSNTLSYTINLTNQSGGSVTVMVTNTLSPFVQFQGVSFGLVPYSYTNIGQNVIFNVGTVTNNGTAQMGINAMPTVAQSLTNTVTVTTNGVISGTPLVFSTQSTNPVPIAGLMVAMSGPTAQVFSNDWMVYSVDVTNLGPSDAPGLFLTNMLPPNVGFKFVSPSNKTFSVSVQKSNVIFNLGTLTNQAVRNFQLTIQPTNAGSLTFSSVLSTNGVAVPNPTNISASITVAVSNFLSNPGQVTATIVSTQKYNQLINRLEQNIVVSNAGPATMPSARVAVMGLTATNWLSNATGTNNGDPFVTYAAPLAAGQSANLVFQYYPAQLTFRFTNSQMRADGVTMPDLSPPASGLIPTNIVLMAKMTSGGEFLEFSSYTNRNFTVEYSSNLTNWMVAQPISMTPANFTAWIDYGPPETISHPTNTPVRFYRVFLGP